MPAGMELNTGLLHGERTTVSGWSFPTATPFLQQPEEISHEANTPQSLVFFFLVLQGLKACGGRECVPQLIYENTHSTVWEKAVWQELGC